MDKGDRFFIALFAVMGVAIIVGIYVSLCRVDFWKDGVAYQIQHHCVRSHSETTFGLQYGYNPMSGKFENYYGPKTDEICDEYRTDTVIVKHPIGKPQ